MILYYWSSRLSQSSVLQEFEDLWSHLAIVFDGGTLGNTEESRRGSTVVNLATPGMYKIIRDGRLVCWLLAGIEI